MLFLSPRGPLFGRFSCMLRRCLRQRDIFSQLSFSDSFLSSCPDEGTTGIHPKGLGCGERLAALAVSGCVTDGVAEQPRCCCGAVTPAGWTRYRKSISGTCNSESVLPCLSCVDNGPIRDLRMEDAKKNGTQHKEERI